MMMTMMVPERPALHHHHGGSLCSQLSVIGTMDASPLFSVSLSLSHSPSLSLSPIFI